MSIEFLRQIRECEVKFAISRCSSYFAPRARIVDVGAGAGWSSAQMAAAGFDVLSIDLKESNYGADLVWPVINYDGNHIPWPDQYFDIVFTSNVLAHVKEVGQLQKEMVRVLKRDGIIVHVVPTASWRFWSNLTYYLELLRVMSKRLAIKKRLDHNGKCSDECSPDLSGSAQKSFLTGFKKNVFPSGLGVRGNSVSQLYYFSRYGWGAFFKHFGLTVVERFSCRLFYTGQLFFDSSLSVRNRIFLSYFLGSACHVFILKEQNRA